MERAHVRRKLKVEKPRGGDMRERLVEIEGRRGKVSDGCLDSEERDGRGSWIVDNSVEIYCREKRRGDGTNGVKKEGEG